MKSNLLVLLSVLFLSFPINAQIKVAKSQKYLVETKTGKPFFWMGDTAWEVFHRLKREDVIKYLDMRKSQGFNVIMGVALAENNGLIEPNRYGDVPFINLDPTNWAVTEGNNPKNEEEYDYWDNVDFVIEEAAKRDLYVGLLPTWGDKVVSNWGAGPQVFNKQNAYTYTKKLAERYKNKLNILWILGGDRPAVYERNGKKHDDRPVWLTMAKGIRDIIGEDAFITYHPGGSADGSAQFFNTDEWLKMNAIQSGHGSRNVEAWKTIHNDLELQPLKPIIDLEPCYEDHPVNPWDGKWTSESRGYFDAYDVRARIYRGVFAGGCGATYGHHSIWQFLDTALYNPINVGDTIISWEQALNAEGATHIHHLKNLMLSRSDLNRVEDSNLIVSDKGKDYKDLIVATRNDAKTYAMIYLPQPEPITINLDILNPGRKLVSWFNPATGEYIILKEKHTTGNVSFTPPSNNQKDWVLVIDVI